MANNLNRVNMQSYTCNHRVMVHNIAQMAFFLNGLLRYVFRNSMGFSGSIGNIVLMGIYHILACNKTDQQYPRTDNMIFSPFQTGLCSFYKFQQK